jgi:hypothetical protein
MGITAIFQPPSVYNLYSYGDMYIYMYILILHIYIYIYTHIYIIIYIFISNPLTGTPLSERFQAAQLEERFQELLKPGRAMDFKKSLLERVCVYIYIPSGYLT